MFPRSARRYTSQFVSLILSISLLVMTVDLSVIAGAQGQEQRAGKPRQEKPEGTLPDLEEVQRVSQNEREAPAAIPSTMRSPKVPLEPWNGRRVGDAEPGRRDQVLRAHARRRVVSPPTVLDDQFVQNFFTWTVSRAPSASELTYWNDQLRVAYAQGQPSVKLAAVEFGKTLFESAEYTARNRNDHWYVYDLYKTFRLVRAVGLALRSEGIRCRRRN